MNSYASEGYTVWLYFRALEQWKKHATYPTVEQARRAAWIHAMGNSGSSLRIYNPAGELISYSSSIHDSYDETIIKPR